MKDLSSLPPNFISWEDSVARVGDDEEFLIELLTDLKEMVEENLPNLKDNLESSNFSEIKAIAHSIKGASGNLGLNIIYDITMNLENSAKNSDAESSKKYITDLDSEFANLKFLVSD
jgi:HPt (histidine-containing phosphotransfer) domain-containing protein